MNAVASKAIVRLAYSKTEAAEALGVSPGFFRTTVLPELRVVRRGRRVLVPQRELDRWLERSAALDFANAE
jgi:excisionase family DNA binding protein